MKEQPTVAAVSSDLTFILNDPGKSLRERFGVLLGNDTRYFDCLAGYFFISGFYKLYPSLENVEKVRILIGLQTDRTAYELLQKAKEQSGLALKSHAAAKDQVANEVLSELEQAADTAEIETGVHKFIEWVRSGKLDKGNIFWNSGLKRKMDRMKQEGYLRVFLGQKKNQKFHFTC